MAQVSITINGRSYLVACDDGQEDHLLTLGGYIDEKVQQMIQQVGTAGPVGGSRLLVLAALVIADELYEAQRELETGERQPGAERPRVPPRRVHAIRRFRYWRTAPGESTIFPPACKRPR